MESAGSGGGLTDQRKARGVLGGRAMLTGLAALLKAGGWLLTLPFRLLRAWARDAWIAFQRRGYLLIATLIAAYVGLYSVMEARHERQTNRALFERANFMTMVASGHRGTFIAAMKTFGPVQTMTVPRDPALLDPWTWWAQERPNEAPLHAWALAFFPLCTAETCGRPDEKPPWRIDLGGAFLIGAGLIGANLEGAVLMGAMLNRADLRVTKLRGANLRGANLRGAILFGADLTEADLTEANLTGADLTGVHSLTQAQFDLACVDDTTHLPEGLTRPPPCPRLSWPIPRLDR